MKAIAINAFKETPQLMDLPKPGVRPGAMIVKMQAAGLNPFDWKMIDGILDGAMRHQFPMIIGVDGAGVVQEVGEGVTRFKAGDRVYGQFIHVPIGEGAFAEYIVVPEKAGITKAPESIDAVAAAAVPTAGMTALQLLEKLQLKQGDLLLINGATGGVGSFATQMAAAKGIQVIATVSSAEGAVRMKRLGASKSINYEEAPIYEQIQTLYPEGIHGIIDLVSQAAGFSKNLGLLKPGGGALTTVFVANEEEIKSKGLHGGNFETKGSAASMDQLTALIDSGDLTIPVETKITLSQVPEAIQQSRHGRGKGKTVIQIAS
ncbi:NADP-dependent oxidoreductase [Chitinophaga sp. Cy-1792]|uniref:NADP-dependent oxidoreductase n=1 Tax=Chitinophaga sp. Cy-1792 TaxID=2608339 RepID=UPI0014225675|nr:NADP-dependent oxidoreductase [Chitinophaga sp. Cy-1792]NIG56203.1 NADP-dependent oxidoreductase [Chitinophaga sp. Cy-1792]